MLTIEINKTNVSRVWRTTANEYHYPHGKPAVSTWGHNEQKKSVHYIVNGQHHRENQKPAYTSWDDNGQKQESYFVLGEWRGTHKPRSYSNLKPSERNQQKRI